MIDQVLEAKEYLAGNGLFPDNMYRICFLMAKYLLSQGLSHKEVRDRIFTWGKSNSIYIKQNINDIIVKAQDDKSPLKSGVEVWISSQDVSEIVSRFDKKYVRCTALAMLCYSKVYANKNGEFAMPERALTAWLGQVTRSVYQRAIRELVLFEYLEVVDRSGHTYRWNKKKMPDGTIYKLSVPVNSGRDYKLDGNNIWKLYSEIFIGK